MLIRLHREIEKLKQQMLALGAVVEERVRMAVQAVDRRDEAMAEQVIEGDLEIDQMEVELEEEGLKILALHQPVAIDLRFIVAILKINNDLERVGDLAVNIAERAAFLATKPPIDIPFDFPAMAEKAQAMLRKSLDALVDLDEQLAYEVCEADDEVDAINREMYELVEEGIRRHPERMDCLIHLLGTSRHLERIADHATNVAEDVVYMIQGDVVRHKAEEYRSQHEGKVRPPDGGDAQMGNVG